MDEQKIMVGIIGGTGLENPDILQNAEERKIDTPFGQPSDTIKVGMINGVKCALLARHGRKHTISPSQINYRANIWALKNLGCTHVLTTSACGSLREEITPGTLVFVDQFVDRTLKRENTFFDGTPGGPKGVCHIPMNPVFCNPTRQILIEAAKKLDIKHQKTGTLVCIEGPRFSTKFESNLFRSWGVDLVGMTLVPEAILAKELAMCYATICLPTDYDSWRDEIGGVDADSVVAMFEKHCQKAVEILKVAITEISAKDWTKEWADYDMMVKKSIMGV